MLNNYQINYYTCSNCKVEFMSTEDFINKKIKCHKCKKPEDDKIAVTIEEAPGIAFKGTGWTKKFHK